MVVTCPKCGARFEDEYRTWVCPHDTFAANDGQNNFAHHPEALLALPPQPLAPQDLLRLGAFTVAEEHSEGVEAMLTEQEQTYRAVAKRGDVESLIQALLARDRLLAQHGRTLADGRAAGRLLREAMRAVLYAQDAQEVKRLAGMGARRDVESILYALGAEPADAKQLKEHGSTLGPLAPKEDWYGAAVGPDEAKGKS